MEIPGLTRQFGINIHDVPDKSKIYDVIIQICEGLNHMHNIPLLHRDLKPGNILIMNDKVKIIDFGLSKLKNSDSAKEWSTTAGVAGTKKYLPPECLKNIDSTDIKINDKVDIWSLGVIIHQLVTGRKHPFQENENDPWTENVITNKMFIDKSINKDSAVYQIILSNCCSFFI